jgi:hypothetical protein
MLIMLTFIRNKPIQLVNIDQKGLEGYTASDREEEDSSSIPPPSLGLLPAVSV